MTCLVDTYDVGDYRKIILPMMVIRRFDAVLEPTKEKVLKMKESWMLLVLPTRTKLCAA